MAKKLFLLMTAALFAAGWLAAPVPLAAQADGVSAVTTAGTNLRRGATTGSAVVARLPEGTELTVTGDTGAEWLSVTTADGRKGYVRARDVEIQTPRPRGRRGGAGASPAPAPARAAPATTAAASASAVTDAYGSGPMYAGPGTNTALLFADIAKDALGETDGFPLPLQVLGDTGGEWLKVKIAGPYWYPGVGGKSWKEGYMKREQLRLLPANGPGKTVRFLGVGHAMVYTWGEYLPIALSEAELDALPQSEFHTDLGGSMRFFNTVYTYEGSGGWHVSKWSHSEEHWGESIMEVLKVNNPELLHYILVPFFGDRGALIRYYKGEPLSAAEDSLLNLNDNDKRYILSRVYDPDDPPKTIGTSSPAVPAPPVTADFATANDASGGGLVIARYKGAGGSVTIPATIGGKKVTAIGEGAFADSGITKAVIPEGVTEIGNSAFAYCQFLTDVVLPKSLTVIRWGAFSRCTQLRNITIPSSVTTVENGAFLYCESLSDANRAAIRARFGEDAFWLAK
ncbi:MAG: Leucine-rich repeat (LRR) protein-like protein [Treponematales bacterium]